MTKCARTQMQLLQKSISMKLLTILTLQVRYSTHSLIYFTLSELYKVKSVGNYNDNNEHALILLQITDKVLVEKYDNYSYLL